MSKILIVGGAGYIGGCLTDQLIEQNFNPSIVDNLLYETRYLKRIPFQRCDIRDFETMKSIIHEYDLIFFLAGLVGDAACSVDKFYTYDVNVKAVKWLADNFKGKIIFPSSCSVYGMNDELLDEESPPNPLSIYAETKLEAEQYLLKTRPESLIFRLGTIFGLGDPFSRPRLDLVVNLLTMKATRGETLTVFGGEQWRPLLHVKDVATGMIHGMNNNLQGLYNISYKNLTIRNIAEEILSVSRTSQIEYTDIPFEDKRNYKVSNQKLLSTGWTPLVDMKTGISEMFQLFSENRINDPKDPIYHNGSFLKKLYNK